MINTIVFDFGGVLIDWNPEYLYQNIFKSKAELDFFLKDICNAEWNKQQDKGRSFKDGIATLTADFPEHQENIEKYFAQWTDMIAGEIYENTALLKGLKLKYRLFGLTNWSSETLPLVYNQYPFFKYFDGIVVSAEEKMLKPDAEIYHLLIKRYHIIPDQTIFIDDSAANIATAKELGFNTILFNRKMNLENEIKKFL